MDHWNAKSSSWVDVVSQRRHTTVADRRPSDVLGATDALPRYFFYLGGNGGAFSLDRLFHRRSKLLKPLGTELRSNVWGSIVDGGLLGPEK